MIVSFPHPALVHHHKHFYLWSKKWFQEFIELHGARENNLNNVSLRIPKRKITIFTGVSGSGKSSIVF